MDLIEPRERLLWMHRYPMHCPSAAVDGTGLDELSERVRAVALGGIQEVEADVAFTPKPKRSTIWNAGPKCWIANMAMAR